MKQMNTQAYHFINAAACLLPYCIPLPLVIQHKLAFCYFHFALFAAICAIWAVKLCCEVRACTSRSSHRTVKANSYARRRDCRFCVVDKHGFDATVFISFTYGLSIRCGCFCFYGILPLFRWSMHQAELSCWRRQRTTVANSRALSRCACQANQWNSSSGKCSAKQKQKKMFSYCHSAYILFHAHNVIKLTNKLCNGINSG